MLRGAAFVLACGLSAACGAERSDDGAPGESRAACAEGEAPAVTGCRAAGIHPEACPPGFRGEDAGCAALLPPSPCPAGAKANLGDDACRDIAPCGDDPWGLVPVDDATIHVDASYAGGGSDGTAARPFAALAPALAAAPEGALVALAAGTYAGSVEIRRPVRLAGRCPSMVELVGTGPPTLLVQAPAEVRGVSVTGPSVGVLVAHATGVLVEGVRVHDVGDLGIDAESTGPATEVTLRDVLVESCAGAGVNVFGATLVAERVHVRGTTGRPDRPTSGNGFSILRHPSNPSAEPQVSITGSVIEGNTAAGVFARSANVSIDSTVVRDTRPSPVTLDFGAGILMFGDPAAGRRGTYRVGRSVVERNADRGVAVAFADAHLEHVTVTDTRSRELDGERGMGVEISEQASVTVRESSVRGSRTGGIAVAGSEATVEGVLVADTLPSQGSGAGGYGLVSQRLGTVPSTVRVTESVVERSVLVGCAAFASGLELVRVAVRDTRPLGDGTFGDGVGGSALGADAPATVVLEGALVERSARAGAVVFGSFLRMAGSTLRCNALDLDVERAYVGGEREFALEDRGGNQCGCEAPGACSAQSATLAPTPAPPGS